MSIEITCPKCGHPFAPEAVIREEIEKEVRNEAADWKKKKNEEYLQKLEEEKKRIEEIAAQKTREHIESEYKNKLTHLQETNKSYEDKLKEARQQQLEFLKKEQELKDKEQELEINVQKKLQEEREKLSLI